MAEMLLFDMHRTCRRYKPRVYREIVAPEPYSHNEYLARYRFSPESIAYLSEMLADDLRRPTRRGHALPVDLQVKMALRFYASGSFLQVIGDTFGHDKSTVSRVIFDVTEALCRRGDHLIKWPVADADRHRVMDGFHNISGFPSVIGAVDGTHIRIQAPKEMENVYVNRKNYHSINVQGICDHEGKFTNIVAKWPGSTHDSFIFRNSNIGLYLDQHHRGFDLDGLLLGDSGYACKPYLLTPYLRPNSRAQERYNSARTRTRCVIERTFGRWKRMFHVLHSEIRMEPARVCKIILACGILLNYAIMQGDQLEEDVDAPEDMDLQTQHGDNESGTAIRNLIANRFFS